MGLFSRKLFSKVWIRQPNWVEAELARADASAPHPTYPGGFLKTTNKTVRLCEPPHTVEGSFCAGLEIVEKGNGAGTGHSLTKLDQPLALLALGRPRPKDGQKNRPFL
jgi:hypothetical protein